MGPRTLDTLPFDIFDLIVSFINDEVQYRDSRQDDSVPDHGTFSLHRHLLPNEFKHLTSTIRRNNLRDLSRVNKHFRDLLNPIILSSVTCWVKHKALNEALMRLLRLKTLHLYARHLTIKIVDLQPGDKNYYSSIPFNLAELLGTYNLVTKLSVDIPDRYHAGLAEAMKSPYINLTRVMALHMSAGLECLIDHCPNVQGLIVCYNSRPSQTYGPNDETPSTKTLLLEPPAQLKHIGMEGHLTTANVDDILSWAPEISGLELFSHFEPPGFATAFSVLSQFQYLEELTLPGMKKMSWGFEMFYRRPGQLSDEQRLKYIKLRNNAFIKVSAMLFESCFALRLIRFMPDRQHITEGYDQDYNKHDSPYVLSVEAGRDSNGSFSTFRWRPRIGPLDSSLQASRHDFHNQNEGLGEKLFPIMKRTALSGGIDVVPDDAE